MKTIITSIITAAVLFFNSTTSKAENHSYNNATADNTINWYIGSVTEGQAEGVANLFDEHFTQNVTNKGKAFHFNKTQVVGFLKAHQNIKQQNCTTAYSIVEENDETAIAKVEIKYRDFTKVDYVTLNREGQEWKISQVVTVYP